MFKLFISIIIVFTFSACSTTAKVWPPFDKLEITADEGMNPDGKGVPSPMQLKVYELSERETFDNLNFDRAFNQAKSLLSDTLLTEKSLTLQPNVTLKHKIDLNKETQFIAVVAGFIDIDNAQWKHVYAVNPKGYQSHSITVTSNDIIVGKLEDAEPEE